MSDNRKRHYSSESDSEDYLQWKISKLQGRLKSRTRKRQFNLGSPSSFSDKHRACQRTNSSRRRRVISVDASPSPVRSLDSDSDNVPLSFLAQSTVSTLEENVTEKIPTIDKDILALLGDEEPLQEVVGPSIHSDLAARWSTLLGKGSSDEALNLLIKKYPPVENCLLLRSPRLNSEIASAITEQVSRRDANFVRLQSQVGAALSALGHLISSLLSEEGGGDKRKHIELASDASRLLLDFHHKYSVIRRDLLLLNLRSDLKDTLTSVSADGWLFGSDLGERIKATKDLKKTALDLKPFKSPKRPVPGPKNTHLNLLRPSRQTLKGASRGGRQSRVVGPSQQRQIQRNSFPQSRHRRVDVQPRDNRRKY